MSVQNELRNLTVRFAEMTLCVFRYCGSDGKSGGLRSFHATLRQANLTKAKGRRGKVQLRFCLVALSIIAIARIPSSPSPTPPCARAGQLKSQPERGKRASWPPTRRPGVGKCRPNPGLQCRQDFHGREFWYSDCPAHMSGTYLTLPIVVEAEGKSR
ncbi:hypothetical protein B0T22DRAFT_455041 [Podospora appendiculata]|uniref:Uncharacterized protein n=1 Tax=Podospora appendiculata TaxID=314037 RepID=A0AAE0XLE5_9PEZI|nr:hypothetical protein B0T22DRAFT_455041 [Podospora appendiculata]